MDTLALVSLAVGPGIAIAYYIYFRDKFEKEPRKLLMKSFLLGVYSLFPAVLIELTWLSFYEVVRTDFLSVAFYSFVIVALSEEFFKYVFLRWFAYPNKSFNEPFDGIVYAVMIGMGFATFENLRYVFGETGGYDLAVLRMFSAVPAHAIFGIMMGYFVGLAKFKRRGDGLPLHLAGLFTAVIFHGGYNFFLIQANHIALYLGAVAVIIIGIFVSLRAIKIRTRNSPFKNLK